MQPLFVSTQTVEPPNSITKWALAEQPTEPKLATTNTPTTTPTLVSEQLSKTLSSMSASDQPKSIGLKVNGNDIRSIAGLENREDAVSRKEQELLKKMKSAYVKLKKIAVTSATESVKEQNVAETIRIKRCVVKLMKVDETDTAKSVIETIRVKPCFVKLKKIDVTKTATASGREIKVVEKNRVKQSFLKLKKRADTNTAKSVSVKRNKAVKVVVSSDSEENVYWRNKKQVNGSLSEDEDEDESDDRRSFADSNYEISSESENEYQPSQARTARKKGCVCQICNQPDNPDWMLLCDKCDKGYHCSCLDPVLFVIPEGNWFCPRCEHEKLIGSLEQQLNKFKTEKEEHLQAVRKREQNRLRMERFKEWKMLSSVNIANVLLDDDDDKKERKLKAKSARKRPTSSRRRRRRNYEYSGGSSDDKSSGSDDKSTTSDTSSSDDVPIYKLRKRPQTNVDYRSNGYDELFNQIEDEKEENTNIPCTQDDEELSESEKEEVVTECESQESENEELDTGGRGINSKAVQTNSFERLFNSKEGNKSENYTSDDDFRASDEEDESE